MTKPLNFQQIIMKLQQYWADYGCLIWFPYSEKVGAGTANTATTLRALGPEPWNVAYVEPSFRPDDGRYAENPNRMQMHTQFQVILKPDPGNPQELYLESLYVLGIKPEEHDIRFVEDNWESPALGAWGLGWEVWLDGLEITQYTYFQQFGGFDTDPVAVELTYGLERIALYLQGVSSVWEIDWDGEHTYGDILRRQEVEYCTYNFEVADVTRMVQSYNIFEQEAKECLARGLIVPAHDYVLRCSHTFNILDARGAIGVTERARYFARMRELSRQVAAAFIQQREQAGHPFLKPPVHPTQSISVPSIPQPTQPLTFLLEIGTEELPPQDLSAALTQLREGVPALLERLRLKHGMVRVMGTPRRLVVLIDDLAERQQDEEQLVKGPPAHVAYDAEGKPTRAAEGFARSQQVLVIDLQIREAEGGRYVFAVRRIPGRPVAEVLSTALPELIASLKFEKSMR
ncbi:MAG: glycine--tRNA ligase subunit alpha, partial [Anaerolineae bacterium]